jgi:crotonobetainyl-CoA:carnitine CoA-transferase CaiB-like acyl-CoA transferase
MLLADNGARVLKVEPPGDGDRLRSWNPSGFLVWNRGKESVCVDLRTDQGRSEVRDLASECDIVIDGLRPGALRRARLEYDDLRRLNEGLVYCAVRGFDETGPYSHIRAYEGVMAAKVGLFNQGIWGFREDPIFLNAPVLSISVAHLALGSLAAALFARETQGTGQRLEVSMYTAASSYDYGLTPAYQYRRRHNPSNLDAPKSIGGSRGIIHGCSADNRWFVFMNLLPYQSREMVKALGMGHLLDDPRFAGTPYFASPELAEEYELTMMECLRGLPGDQIVARMLANPDVGFEEIRSSRRAFSHPQVAHNECTIEVEDPVHGYIRQIGPIARFSRTPSRVRASAPRRGENHLVERPLPRSASRMTDPVPPAARAPLDGMTVLEVGYYFAMPYGLMLAATLGARVIKIEGPSGDPWRMLTTSEPEVSSSQCLQGKESVAVDIKTKDGLDVLHRLVRKADAFVYSLRQNPADLGISYNQLKAVNPDLVYIHRPGYGTDGPYAGRPMYAHIADAAAGMYPRNCGYWLAPERCEGAGALELKAIQVPRMATDRMYADGHGANGVFCMTAMGLLAKRRFGFGQYVEGSMLTGALYGLSDEFVDYVDAPPVRRPDADQMGLDALYRLYRASDGWVFIAAPTQGSWLALTEAIGRPDLAQDPRLTTPTRRLDADLFLVGEIAKQISAKRAVVWEKELNAVGVGCAAASNLQYQGFTSLDPRLRESGLTHEVEHPTLGPIVQTGPAARFSGTPAKIETGSVYGQNTESVLRELGYKAAEIEDFIARRVAFRSEPQSRAGLA